MHNEDSKRMEKEFDVIYAKMLPTEQVLKATGHKTAAVRPSTTHHKTI